MCKRLPITLITGFLGSGKTTLLKFLLRNTNRKLAVIVNEFGDIGLDGDLFKSCGFCPQGEAEDRIVELNNGCLCCTVQDDFLPTIECLLSRSDGLDGILIETSGLALPAPLLNALHWPSIRAKVHINGVVTLVDGEALNAGSPIGDISAYEQQRLNDESVDHLTPLNDLFLAQLDCADLVLISRADCISHVAFKNIQNNLSSKVRSATSILPIINGQIDPSIVLGIDHQDVVHISEKHEHEHLKILSSSVRVEIPLEKNDLERVLLDLVVKYQIVRLKGRCWLPGKLIPLQVQMVGSRLNTWYEKVPSSSWKPSEYGLELVILSFIGGADEAIISAFSS